MNEITYPRLSKRIQAILIDSIFVPIAMYTSVAISGVFEFEVDLVKAFFLIGPIVILEPGLVALTGGTIGHHLLGIKVRRANQDKNINFILASFRFILKLLLGWLSLVLVLTTKRHQAIHDYLVSSIVVNKSNRLLSSYESLPERIVEEAGYNYPAKFKRIFVMIPYCMVITCLMLVFIFLLSTVDCTNNDWCDTALGVTAYFAVTAWLLALGTVVVCCWRARLYGCRRKLVL